MNIKIKKIIENNINKVIISAYNFSEADLILFEKYGEPIINLGGTVGSDTYPNKLQQIKTDSPFNFSLPIDNTSQEKCDLWIDYITNQITEELSILRFKDYSWEKEIILTI